MDGVLAGESAGVVSSMGSSSCQEEVVRGWSMEGEESERGQTEQTRKGKARQGKSGQDKTRQREREREREGERLFNRSTHSARSGPSVSRAGRKDEANCETN